jgi:predicted acyltransferase
MTAPAPAVIEKGGAFASSRRLGSLDVFRGFTIAAMVLVNNQLGGAYAQLRHAEWHGWTFTDLVFPSFLWIAGVAATLSTARRVERGESRGALFAHAARRAAWLFLIGLTLNALWGGGLAGLRIPGVLQRIALCYLAGTAIYLTTSVRGRLVWIVALLSGYWAAMAPGGYEKVGNVAAQLDLWLMPGHLYTDVYDPEGLLTSAPAIVTFLLGVLAGDWLRARRENKAAALAAAGAGLFAMGLALDLLQPINKALWTVPYTVLAGGLSTLAFAGCYWAIDERGWSGAGTRFWTIFGVNALAVYVFHAVVNVLFGLGPKAALSGWLQGLASPANAALVYSLVHVGLSFAFAWLLWRRLWFLKL